MRTLIPEIGETRIVPKFLLFPMTLKREDGRLEVRGLEFASIRYEWRKTKCGAGWCPIAWADGE